MGVALKPRFRFSGDWPATRACDEVCQSPATSLHRFSVMRMYSHVSACLRCRLRHHSLHSVTDNGFWRVKFAVRHGQAPRLSMATSSSAEIEEIVKRLRWLIEEQKVRPEDILVLGMTKGRIERIAEAVAVAKINSVEGLHAFREQDKLLGQRSTLTLSTTAAAKGYDAYCVMLASAHEFDRNLVRRTNFYVGCTRAIEYLEVFAHRNEGLVIEWERVLARQRELA